MKHGKYQSPEYHAWERMIQRCCNPNNPKYPGYGARGIKVCVRWRKSFIAFYTDMGERPGQLYSLERKDNDKHYNPRNCIWATRSDQANNRRTSRKLIYRGITKTVHHWAKDIGISEITLHMRLRAGWSVEKALTQPLRKKRGLTWKSHQ